MAEERIVVVEYIYSCLLDLKTHTIRIKDFKLRYNMKGYSLKIEKGLLEVTSCISFSLRRNSTCHVAIRD